MMGNCAGDRCLLECLVLLSIPGGASDDIGMILVVSH